MDTALAGLPVIDVDTHFTEPPDFWTSRAPAALRDRAPRMVTFDDGVERWVADADTVLGPVGYCVVRQDGSKVRGTVSLDTFAELHAAASNPIDRLRFMDGLGVVAQVLRCPSGPSWGPDNSSVAGGGLRLGRRGPALAGPRSGASRCSA